MPRVLVNSSILKRWTGLQECMDTMTHLADDMNQEAATEAAKQLKNLYVRAGFIMVQVARDLAPYDPTRTEGTHLRDAIIVSRGDPTKQNAIVMVDRRLAPHAWWEEYGTVSAQPQPYMRPALAETRVAMLQEIENGFGPIIQSIVDKYGSK